MWLQFLSYLYVYTVQILSHCNDVSWTTRPQDQASVGTSVTYGFDFEPPLDLSHNATHAEIKKFERNEREYNQYREHQVSICATLYQSFSNDIQNRVNQDPKALSHKNNGELVQYDVS